MVCRSSAVLLLVLVASPAWAQDLPAEDPAAAAQAFRAGVAAVEARRWQEALDAFDLSYRLRPHPNTLLNIAGAQAETGRLVEAVATYRRFLSDVVPTPENAAVRAAAEDYAVKCEARVAHLVVTVQNTEPGDVARIDGVALSEFPPGPDFRANPGVRRVDILRDGQTVATATVRLVEGERRTVVLAAKAIGEPAPGAASAGSVKGGAARDVDDDATVFESWWFWTAVGVVVVGGAVTAGVLLSGDNETAAQGNLGTVRVP